MAAPKPSSKRAQSESPLSETIIPKIKGGTKGEVLADLRDMAEAFPEKVITRNYYRVNGKYAESAWNSYFGTFEEFKRQAGIILSRQAHQLEKALAKHASVDHYRQISAERADWGNRYTRDKGGRFKTIMGLFDLHDEEIDPFYRRVMIDVAKRLQPDVVCFGGDVFDLPEFGKYTVDPREWNPVRRIRFVHTGIFGPIRAVCPDSQIDFVEGNHEARLLRMLADATPALRAVLSELHGMTVSKLLGLEQFEINYVAACDLAAYTARDLQDELRKNHRIYWNSVLINHLPDARDMGMPGANGHNHKHIVWPMFTPVFGAYEWHQSGCGHKRDASYTNGEKWHMGFPIINVDTHTRATLTDYVTVGETFAVAGGKTYYRQPSEVVTGGPLSFDKL